MRTPLYDAHARKKTVSVTINPDLWGKSRAAGLNLSEIAETAIAAAFVAVERARIRAEIEQELEVYNKFIAEHGSCAKMMREREAARERDEAV
jgi:post-segregation antitoxin (ccd killing protein)